MFVDVQVVDDKHVRRRFRVSTAQSSARVRPFMCSMPLKLRDGWNLVTLDLANLTQKAFGTSFVEVTRVQIHAACRLRRVFFSDKVG